MTNQPNRGSGLEITAAIIGRLLWILILLILLALMLSIMYAFFGWVGIVGPIVIAAGLYALVRLGRRRT